MNDHADVGHAGEYIHEGQVDDDADGEADAAATAGNNEVDAEDARAVPVALDVAAALDAAVEDVVADGDEADGDIRIIGIPTTSPTAASRAAATSTGTRRARAAAASTSLFPSVAPASAPSSP